MSGGIDFEWDRAHLKHIAFHRVAPEEAEQVIANDPMDIGTQTTGEEERTLNLGRTDHGRVLVVVTTMRGERIRVITAEGRIPRLRADEVISLLRRNGFALIGTSTRGSGNVFRDLRHANADIEQFKAILAAGIIKVPDLQGLSVREAHGRTGIAAADFSRIRNADLSRFTVDRLMSIINWLGSRIEVKINLRREENAQPAGAGALTP